MEKEPQRDTSGQETLKQEETLRVEHNGEKFMFSHVNNPFFPLFAYLRKIETDEIVTVAWGDLKEEVRQKITDHLKQPKKEEEEEYPYDLELYLTLLRAPTNVQEALQEQARGIARTMASLGSMSRHIDQRDEIPANLLEEVAMGIATAKKKNEQYGRTFAPINANLILEWLRGLGLNPQKSGDRISVDFSDQKK